MPDLDVDLDRKWYPITMPPGTTVSKLITDLTAVPPDAALLENPGMLVFSTAVQPAYAGYRPVTLHGTHGDVPALEPMYVLPEFVRMIPRGYLPLTEGVLAWYVLGSLLAAVDDRYCSVDDHVRVVPAVDGVHVEVAPFGWAAAA